MANIQFITDSKGKKISAVVPIELFEKLTRNSDIDELFEHVQNETSISDDVFTLTKSSTFFLKRVAPCKPHGASIEG